MKKFIIENWFKLTIVGIVILIGLFLLFYFIIFIPQKEQQMLVRQAEERAKLEELQKEKELSDPKSDKYIVTYDKEGNPLDWTVLTRASVILNDTLTTYQEVLPVIQKTQTTEREILSKLYSVLKSPYLEDKASWQNLINHDEAYIASGEKVITLLSNLIKNYQGLHTAVSMRDPQLYLYYEEEISKLEAQKSLIMKDYSDKEAKKKYYASFLSS